MENRHCKICLGSPRENQFPDYGSLLLYKVGKSRTGGHNKWTKHDQIHVEEYSYTIWHPEKTCQQQQPVVIRKPFQEMVQRTRHTTMVHICSSLPCQWTDRSIQQNLGSRDQEVFGQEERQLDRRSPHSVMVIYDHSPCRNRRDIFQPRIRHEKGPTIRIAHNTPPPVCIIIQHRHER